MMIWKLFAAASAILVLTTVVLVLNHFKATDAGLRVYAQNENSADNNVTVNYEYYFNHKVKMKHEIFKDPATGKELRSIHTQYTKNGNIQYAEEYDYDIKTGNKISIICKLYGEQERILQEIKSYYDSQTGAMTSKTQTGYQPNGQISYTNVFNYAPDWNMPISSVHTDYFNGKIFSKREERWDAKTHNKINSTFTMYNEDGSISSKTEEE